MKWNEKLIIYDSYNHKLKIIEGDLVSDFIGIGTPGHEDSKDFSKVKFNEPSGMCILNDYLYVADTNNHCIRCIDLIQNLCSTVEFKLKSEKNEEKFIYLESLNCQENKKIQFKMIIDLPIGCHLNETIHLNGKSIHQKGKLNHSKSILVFKRWMWIYKRNSIKMSNILLFKWIMSNERIIIQNQNSNW